MDEPSHGLSRFLSCIALLVGGILSLLAALIFTWQSFGWLKTSNWIGLPLRTLYQPDVSWIGVQIILDWFFALPLALVLLTAGTIAFKLMGMLSDWVYKSEATKAGKIVTPSQV
jgi:uncharacterized metal-binding protein